MQIMTDVRHGFRSLVKSPGLTCVALALTLAAALARWASIPSWPSVTNKKRGSA